MIGSRLGPYEITAKLGEGGMGEVWRATDTRLDRQVAIKVLPAAFTADPERLARFEREAKLLAQLHHPNIASIFGLEESDGGRALVMELVEGEELSARIAHGPLPLDEALAIARQIAEALEAAHEQGIVHRDLKPANVKVRADGTVKVLDFGLAKALEPTAGAGGSASLAHSPTLTTHGTQLGVILGTAAYMSPEQARGSTVDKRADVWAFGVVLHEMLTGRRLFDGETVSDTLAGVLRAEIDLDALPAGTPPELRRLLRRCLERNPRNRLRDVGDARLALDELLGGNGGERPGERSEAARPRPATPWLWPMIAGVSAVAAALFGYLWGSHGAPAAAPEPRGERRFAIAAEGRGRDDTQALSLDGKRIAYTAAGGLWLRDLGEVAPRRLAGADGATDPFWSPDGREIGFARARALWRTGLEGGSAKRICELPNGLFEGGSWGEDGTIVFAIATGRWSGTLQSCAANGGVARAVHDPGPVGLRASRPQVLPGGAGVLFVLHDTNDRGEVRILRDGEARVVFGSTRQVNAAALAPDGRLYYDLERAVGGDLWSVALDERWEETIGEPVLIAEGGESPSVARDGALLYAAVETPLWRLAWLSPGGEISALGEPFALNAWDLIVQLSPDDRQASVNLMGGHERIGELWIVDLASGARRRQPTEFEVYSAVWSPDGRELLATGKDRAIALPLSGGGAARELAGAPTLFQPRWAPDGRWIVGYRIEAATGRDLWRIAADGRTPAEPLVREPGQQANPDVSPDGRFLAYQSDESGHREVYVRPYPTGSRKWQVSTAGGVSPVWSRSGGELVWAARNELWSAAVATASGEPVFGAPRLVARGAEAGLDLEPGQRYYHRNFALAADGRRLLVAQRANPGRNEVIYVDGPGEAPPRR